MANTQTLLDTLNFSREEIVTKHYNAAFAELQDKIQKEPLETSFTIRSGCVSKNITDELVRRFNVNGLKAVYGYSGLLRTYHHMKVEVQLPAHLIPVVEIPVMAEVKTDAGVVDQPNKSA